MLLMVTGCSREDGESHELRRLNQKGEYLTRRHQQQRFIIETPSQKPPMHYPWQEKKPAHIVEKAKKATATVKPSVTKHRVGDIED